MSGGQGKSFINLGSKLRVSIAQQDHGDKYVEFVAQPTDYLGQVIAIVISRPRSLTITAEFSLGSCCEEAGPYYQARESRIKIRPHDT